MESLVRERGVVLVTSHRVRTEQVALSLRDWIAAREAEDGYVAEVVTTAELRDVTRRIHGRIEWPGKADQGLVALAIRCAAPLLTHDDRAAGLAAACRIRVVDLVDLGALAAVEGVVALGEVETAFGGLARHAWRPDDWGGSVDATVQGRPSWERHLAALRGWLGDVVPTPVE